MMGLVFERIRDINRSGVAVLLVEQNAREALRMSHRGYVLVAGENRLDDTGPDLMDNPQVASLYLAGCGKTLLSTQGRKLSDDKRRPIACSERIIRIGLSHAECRRDS